MARPKEFDRDVALGAALRVFLEQGYERTTTDDLRRAMGIGRQSLYDTFGDKHDLYLEAFARYNTQSIASFLRGLAGGTSTPDALVRALTSFADDPGGELALGCLGINASCEFGRSDVEVSALIDASSKTFSRVIRELVLSGKARGEFRANVDERKASAFLVATLAGMKVSARAGVSRRALREIAGIAVLALTTNS